MSSIREDVQNSFSLRMKRRKGQMIHDIGILLFVMCCFGATMATIFSSESMLVPEIIMLAATFAGVLLASYGFRYLAVGAAGIQILIFTGYVLFQKQAQSVSIHWTCYIWVFLPLLSVGSMLLFEMTNYQNEHLNQVLTQQMDELVLIHPMTGLYNSRALYLDLQRQMAYTARHDLELTLMCIQLRYASELHKILSVAQFDHLVQILAQNLEDTLRLEDKIYAMDNDGSFAVILGCPDAGAYVVKNRIKSTIAKSEKFDQIVNQVLKVDLRIAYLQYDKDIISDAMEFRQKVENELQYDV